VKWIWFFETVRSKQKIFKTGNSLALTIPAAFVQMVGVKCGQEVEAEIDPEKGKLAFKFFGNRQLPLSQNLFKRTRQKK